MTAADRYLKIVEKHLDNAIMKDEMKCTNCEKQIIKGKGYIQHVIRTEDQIAFRVYCGTTCCYLHLGSQIRAILD